MSHPVPHYVRFARSLALLGGLGAAVGCSATNTPSDDAFVPPGDDAAVATDDAFVPPGTDAFVPPGTDAFVPPSDDAAVATDDAFDMCAACVCLGPGGGGGGGDDAGLPDCYTVPGSEICCAAVGPLAPPDLAV